MAALANPILQRYVEFLYTTWGDRCLMREVTLASKSESHTPEKMQAVIQNVRIAQSVRAEVRNMFEFNQQEQ